MENNSYNPKIHHRKSIRLWGYDYTQSGLYFVTICCQNGASLYGNIKDGEMYHNEPGKMIKRWYKELENKFPDVRCLEMVVMPNHFHCIIQKIIVGADLCVCPKTGVHPKDVGADVGADLCVCPKTSVHPNVVGADLCVCPKTGIHPNVVGADLCVCPKTSVHPNVVGADLCVCPKTGIHPEPIFSEHKKSSLFSIIQWFKTMTTNEYIRGVKNLGWQPFDKRVWQRNYYEHIIRNQDAHQLIANYIINNPQKWQQDRFCHSNTQMDS
jgi:putative transposase